MKRALTALLGTIILTIPAVSFAGNCGDVNNSGSINILDVTYLINYIYKGGPGPDCGETTGTVTDIDDNTYPTVKIGDQWWMAENLKVTHYRNGDSIPNITDGAAWGWLTTGAYCEYDNDIANVAVYGRLYNWYAVDDSRNIAPAGWHVPSDDEWKQLEIYLGLSQAEADAEDCRGTDEGNKLKDTGTTHWCMNMGATNESGFTALPGGYLDSHDGPCVGMTYDALFWSSTEYDSIDAWYRRLYCGWSSAVCRYHSLDKSKRYGFSVRCVKD
ncbi:MAG: hypothetical protein CVT49_15770 [candidate division Zixibacteria bacterium HGW-Zixibacteria-1]|nr:MAG: hypothetical protein CVT49_15770 [candidate division Zixibacteria bacterium HGW-Zixibacteria-1]